MSNTGTLHKECAETVMDAMSTPPRDPGPTILTVQALCRAAGAVRKEDRVLEPPKPEPAKQAKSTRRQKPVTSPAA